MNSERTFVAVPQLGDEVVATGQTELDEAKAGERSKRAEVSRPSIWPTDEVSSIAERNEFSRSLFGWGK